MDHDLHPALVLLLQRPAFACGQTQRQLVAVTGSHLPAHCVQSGSRDREPAAGRDSHIDREPEALHHDPRENRDLGLLLLRCARLLVTWPDERNGRDRWWRHLDRTGPAGVTDARRHRRRHREPAIYASVVQILLTVDVLRDELVTGREA